MGKRDVERTEPSFIGGRAGAGGRFDPVQDGFRHDGGPSFRRYPGSGSRYGGNGIHGMGGGREYRGTFGICRGGNKRRGERSSVKVIVKLFRRRQGTVSSNPVLGERFEAYVCYRVVFP